MSTLQPRPINPNLANLPHVIPLDVEVTPEDIETGVAESCIRCPVALAIMREARRTPYGTSGEAPVMVSGESVTLVTRHRAWYSANLSAEVQAFIQRYDRPDRGPVEPFRFHIDMVWM